MHGDPDKALLYQNTAKKIAAAIELYGWDGEWYRRAYTDEGLPLGASQNDECRIDSIAQSWAVISGAALPDRAIKAIASLREYLLRPKEQLILLLTPPFDKSALEPGYIKGYLPGVRENGGQYTHAAIWVAMAAARLGQGDLAATLLSWINPINHSSNEKDMAIYKVEPYVMAADVYGVSPHVGRGGWTWYTGSSAWMYRATIESLLGLHLEGDVLTIDPCIPVDWQNFNITYRYFSASYKFHVNNPNGVNRGVKVITMDGENCPDGRIIRHDDGRLHLVNIEMGE